MSNNKVFPKWKNCNDTLNKFVSNNYKLSLTNKDGKIIITFFTPTNTDTMIPSIYMEKFKEIIYSFNTLLLDRLYINEVLMNQMLGMGRSNEDIVNEINSRIKKVELVQGYSFKSHLRKQLGIK